MKIAVLGDIHGNLEAFEAVQDDLKLRDIDTVISLGDIIGYGPDPDGVVSRLRQLGYESVLGNHEFALKDERGRRWLNFQSAENNIETEKLLSTDNLNYCCNLPLSLQVAGGHFVHGFPPESVFRYLNRQSDERVSALFASHPATIFFLGHTHKLELVSGRDGQISRRALQEELVPLFPGEKYIVNCGSVGQPRDGDSRAKYLIWDTVQNQLEIVFVDYDRSVTVQKIKERGFPEIYGLRLGSEKKR